jgi:outer membrane protein OmpA-like peptidoglycan-associated protein
MRYTITLASILVLALLAQSASADASREENIGVGSGAVVGALAGGPVGFFIGAAIGAKLGEKAHIKSEQISTLEDSLQDSSESVADLQRGVDDLNIEVEHMQNTARPELIRLMQAGIDMDLLFRTDEFALTDTTGNRLAQMAATLANMTNVQIQLDGFADERGASQYNLALSEKRVEFVRNLLIGSGIHPTRISTSAHGEAVAQDQDFDSYALERRVSVKLFIDNTQTENTQSVASNPN